MLYGQFTLASPSRKSPPQSKACAECHKKESPALYNQWGSSKHYRGNVGCYECHMALTSDLDAFIITARRFRPSSLRKIAAGVTRPKSQSSIRPITPKRARILGSLDNVLAEVVEGNHGFKTPMFTGGVSAAAVNGCWQCHGAEVKIMPNGKPDPAIWPNTGIGRINPDGSEGSCAACHSRHEFSAAQARTPDTCGKCHMGPDHPQIEIYNESKHGIAYRANVDKMALKQRQVDCGRGLLRRADLCHLSYERNQESTSHS